MGGRRRPGGERDQAWPSRAPRCCLPPHPCVLTCRCLCFLPERRLRPDRVRRRQGRADDRIWVREGVQRGR
uniref:Uncharacterized protein n=1 Tax=Arundo donax TaxID=35708 RepID=A0A0A9GDF4_ARUDO